MTDFAAELKRCRNPRCRSKLPAPTDNPHKAFCSRGCHGSFYLSRCLVCEKDKPTKRANRLFCRRPKCKSEYRQNKPLFTFPGTGQQIAPVGVRKPYKSGIKTRHFPTGNRCLIQPHHPPVNILGGYKFPDAPIIDLSPLPAMVDGVQSDWKACLPSDHATLPDLSIPDFLKREVAA